ncbi:MAG: hypothetical protein ABSA39_04415 [Edaphobacter sp.]
MSYAAHEQVHVEFPELFSELVATEPDDLLSRRLFKGTYPGVAPVASRESLHVTRKR